MSFGVRSVKLYLYTYLINFIYLYLEYATKYFFFIRKRKFRLFILSIENIYRTGGYHGDKSNC